MAAFEQPAQWSHTLGNNADVVTLPDDTDNVSGQASLQKLFQLINQVPLSAGGVAPSRTDFNALFKLLGDSIYYMQQGGVWSYQNTFDYDVGAIVRYDNKIWTCIQVNGVSSTVVTPGTDINYWARVVNNSKDGGGGGVDVGFVVPFAGTSTIPDGFLLCNGAAVSRTDFADLFAVIGTTYGEGDGSTTFALPDYRDRVLQGSSATHAAGTSIEAGLPNITGSLSPIRTLISTTLTSSGAYQETRQTTDSWAGFIQNSANVIENVKFNASLSNPIYSRSTTVQMPASSTQYLIKY